MARYLKLFFLAFLVAACEAGADTTAAAWADPACPGKTDPVTVTVFLQSGSIYLEATPYSVEGSDGVIHIVVVKDVSSDVIFGSGPTIPLGVLPIGTYRVEVALRARNKDGTFGPEEPQPSFDLVVGEVARACTPKSVISVDYYLGTKIATAFASPLTVQVFDKEQRPVPGAVVHFVRIARPEESIASGPIPDATLSSESATTDDNGVAQVTAVANSIAGSYQIEAKVFSRIQLYYSVFVLSNRDDAVGAPVVPVVEYGGFKFFYTSNPDEMRALDVTGGWFRTGAVFLAFPPGSSSPVFPSQPVCRYMGRPKPAPYSHFFSLDASECATLHDLYPDVWLLEADDVFEALAPDPANGDCSLGTIPLFRLFATKNDGNPGPSHRFTDSAGYQAWLLGHGPGYVAEGAGPGVAMCVLP